MQLSTKIIFLLLWGIDMTSRFLALACLFFFIPKGYSAEWGVKFNPIYSLLGIYDLGYDKSFKENQKLSVGLLYADLNASDVHIKGQGLGLMYTFHSDGVFEDGWLWGPFIGIASLSYEDIDKEETGDIDFLAGGLGGGYQVCWEEFFVEFMVKLAHPFKSESQIKDNKTGNRFSKDLVYSTAVFDFKVGFLF